MSQKPSPPRGTRDFLPESLGGRPSTETWEAVETIFRDAVRRHGYSEIRTPVYESAEVFNRAVGEHTDVKKEIWTFQDKKGRELALRPEGTASVVRAALTAGLFGKNQPLRLFYMGPMFRYERPQAGRYRQHHQAGVEFFGNPSAEADAQVISLSMEFVSKLGLQGLSASTNSIGCRNCRPGYLKILKGYLLDQTTSSEGELCSDCRERSRSNPLRALDCKRKDCQPILDKAPHISESLCKECQKHNQNLIRGLEAAGVSFVEVPRLVRGFDYYSRTVFEVLSKDLGAQNAVLGGGRYDYLVHELGGPEVPAVGFSSGLDRLIHLAGDVVPALESKVKAFMITLGDKARTAAGPLVSDIRSAGEGRISLVWDDLSAGLSAQLKKASSWGYDAAVILGDKELEGNSVIIRNLRQSVQLECPQNRAGEELIKILKANGRRS